jgi:pimeloyl-ACP methyl ester carboxylesterase
MPSFVTSDGVSLHYTDTGPAAGTTIVLVAGFLAAAATWLPQVNALRAADHRAVCLDRRSHGRSAAPAHGPRPADGTARQGHRGGTGLARAGRPSTRSRRPAWRRGGTRSWWRTPGTR